MTSSTPVRLHLRIGGLCLLAMTAACGGGGAAATSIVTRSPSASVSPAVASTRGAPSATSGATSGAQQAPVPVESNPPGDIPDNIAYVTYRNAPGGYRFRYPEGWARTGTGTAVRLTDKLNGIDADTAGAPAAPTPASVRVAVIPLLRRNQPAFELRAVEPVTLPAGTGVRVVYRRNSAPDPVTGRQVRDEVESYLIAARGKSVRLDLFGPVGADNVDAYRTISRSLALS